MKKKAARSIRRLYKLNFIFYSICPKKEMILNYVGKGKNFATNTKDSNSKQQSTKEKNWDVLS